jgi:ADP-heptose:LPS heptosyltransferase
MRILLVQLKRIGDLVLTTPAICCLREKYPEAELVLAIEGGSTGLLPLVDHDRAIVLRRGKLDLPQWTDMVRETFDVCLDFTGNDRSAMVALFSYAPRRITWKRFAAKPFRRMIYTEFVESRVQDRHTADHHTDLLRALDIERSGVPAQLHVSEELRQKTAHILQEHGVEGAFAVIHPGSVRPEKFWTAEGWAAVVRELVEGYDLPVVLTGSASAREMEHLEQVWSFFDPAVAARVVRLAGKLTLSELAGILQQARLVCGVDSAPLHFADALRVPVLALFGPTNPHQWRPRQTASAIVVPPGTGPIGPKYHLGAPVGLIPVEEVLAALRGLLADAG